MLNIIVFKAQFLVDESFYKRIKGLNFIINETIYGKANMHTPTRRVIRYRMRQQIKL